jgi:RHS repeat-associated protein
VTVPAMPAGETFSWLGAHNRHSAAGILNMGARSYAPGIGRFLQIDPVLDGSANDYDYVNQDPVNETDLPGTGGLNGVCTKENKIFNRRLCEAAGGRVNHRSPDTSSRYDKLCRMAKTVSLGTGIVAGLRRIVFGKPLKSLVEMVEERYGKNGVRISGGFGIVAVVSAIINCT